MRVLLVKTSSMGDVVKALPAVTDAAKRHPGLRLDWVVEEDFAPICAAHHAVGRVLPIALRRWRRDLRRRPLFALRGAAPALRCFREELRAISYDAVIDGQGLLKSAAIAKLVR